ncbi:hypothetical protein ElyMa_002432300 [Elysia marginata]|uniref:Uncharacterized protein n=1 Tax=Elysia marginata TaxID=1093978 RepID=A0AAV4GJZ5_9GAST|nr:hypothetical protein ElyMa_002432300 [Elysia marginata]
MRRKLFTNLQDSTAMNLHQTEEDTESTQNHLDVSDRDGAHAPLQTQIDSPTASYPGMTVDFPVQNVSTRSNSVKLNVNSYIGESQAKPYSLCPDDKHTAPAPTCEHSKGQSDGCFKFRFPVPFPGTKNLCKGDLSNNTGLLYMFEDHVTSKNYSPEAEVFTSGVMQAILTRILSSARTSATISASVRAPHDKSRAGEFDSTSRSPCRKITDVDILQAFQSDDHLLQLHSLVPLSEISLELSLLGQSVSTLSSLAIRPKRRDQIQDSCHLNRLLRRQYLVLHQNQPFQKSQLTHLLLKPQHKQHCLEQDEDKQQKTHHLHKNEQPVPSTCKPPWLRAKQQTLTEFETTPSRQAGLSSSQAQPVPDFFDSRDAQPTDKAGAERQETAHVNEKLKSTREHCKTSTFIRRGDTTSCEDFIKAEYNKCGSKADKTSVLGNIEQRILFAEVFEKHDLCMLMMMTVLIIFWWLCASWI